MRYAPFVLAALCVLTLFVGLDRVGVLDEREARDAQVARELIQRREVLTPLYAASPLYEKPTPAYALEALALWHDPAPPLDSRRMRAVLAVLLVLVTGVAGARHFGPRAGVFAAGALATSVALPLAARSDGTQLLGTLFAWIGCEGLADVVFGRARGRDLRLVVTYGAMAAALLCAGPLTALWPLGGLALYLVLARDRTDWRHARPLAGLALMLGLALPWYGAMAERHGAAFLARAPFFPYAVGPPMAWFAGLVFAVPFLIVGAYPWSALLPDAMSHAATWWRARLPLLRVGPVGPEVPPVVALERERREERAAHFFIACLLAALVPMLVYPSHPLTAALPAVPAAALLCGRLLDHLFEDPRRLGPSFTRSTLTLAVVGSVAAAALAALAGRLSEAAPALRSLAAVSLLTSWAPFLADLLHRKRLAALLMVLPVALGTPIVSLGVLPAMEDWLDTRTAVAAFEFAAPPRAPLTLVDAPPPSLRFYLRRNLVIVPPEPDTLRDYRAADGMTYLAFRPSREREVARDVSAPLEILARTPTLIMARVPTELRGVSGP
jgi:4-amino-4-deoxy-L-arabinose transferase-like glycosyltransferase